MIKDHLTARSLIMRCFQIRIYLYQIFNDRKAFNLAAIKNLSPIYVPASMNWIINGLLCKTNMLSNTHVAD